MKKLLLLSLTVLLFSCSNSDESDDNSECEKVVYSFDNYDLPDGQYEIMIVSKNLWDLAAECGYDCAELMEIDNQIENARERLIVNENTFLYYLNQSSFCAGEFNGSGFSCSQFSTEICWEGVQ